MTTTGKLLIETSNDESFIVGHTYSITATVSQKIDVFGITDVTPVEVVDTEIASTDTTDTASSTDTTDTTSENPNSTPPATP